MTISKRIKDRRQELGISVEELADRINKNKATIYRYENGYIGKVPYDILEPLSEALGVTIGYLVGSEDTIDEPNSNTKIESNFNQYKYFPVSISAGALEHIDGITEFDWIALSDELLGKYAGRKSIILLKVNGESMNKIIPDGSYIVVDTTKTSVTDLCDKDIVVFTNNGEGYSVKRYVNDTANQRFIFKPESDDDTFTPIIVNYEDSTDLKVVGKVVKYIVNLD